MMVLHGLLMWIMLNSVGHQLLNVMMKDQRSIQAPWDALPAFVGLLVLIVWAQLIQWLHLPTNLLYLLPVLAAWGLVMGVLNKTIDWRQPRRWLMMALMAVAVWFLVSGMPLAAWDSWLGWEMKAQQWLDHGLSAPLHRYEDWVKQPGGWVNPTAHYPDGLSLLFYVGLQWFANNQWLAWVLALMYVQLVVTVTNHLDQKQAPISLQVLAGLMLLTLPLINNHIMMFGYADIWLAMVMLLVVIRGELWNQFHQVNDGRLALMLCALLPAFKAEGWVWMALLLFAHFFSKFLIRKHRWVVVLLAATMILLWFGLDPWAHSWAGRTVVISQSLIQMGDAFSLQLIPQDVSFEMFSGLFLQNNWGLLWFFLPAVLVVWAFGRYPKHTQVSQTFLVLSFVAFVVLFTFTDASRWAENYTAINRITLQLAPVFVYLFIATWLDQKRAA